MLLTVLFVFTFLKKFHRFCLEIKPTHTIELSRRANRRREFIIHSCRNTTGSAESRVNQH